MLEAGKYDIVHKLFESMQRNGLALKALTYKILVRAFWREGRVNDAIMAVRDMEQKGIIGEASVYYELARCLCNSGMWKDAFLEVQKLKRLPLTRPLEVAFTGLIQSSMDGGHLHDCISIFKHMKDHCDPNIGTINIMLKVYGRIDMFAKAKELFEAAKEIYSLTPDAYSYILMLEASATSHQWEYFEHIYKEMTLRDYHLYQERHTALLLQASRAGKPHLLEHTFEIILESGQVPHVSLFTEMLFNSVAKRNYEGAASLINSMAHASMHICERQWINLLEKNKEHIDEEKMHALLDILSSDSVIKEEPVLSLTKSLKYICTPRKSLDRYIYAERMSDSDDHIITKGTNKVLNDSSMLSTSHGNIVNKVGYVENLEGMRRPVKRLMEECHHEEKMVNHVDALASCYASDCDANKVCETSSNGKSSFDVESLLESLTNHVDYSCRTELPSALEILHSWKDNRFKNGAFPLQP